MVYLCFILIIGNYAFIWFLLRKIGLFKKEVSIDMVNLTKRLNGIQGDLKPTKELIIRVNRYDEILNNLEFSFFGIKTHCNELNLEINNEFTSIKDKCKVLSDRINEINTKVEVLAKNSNSNYKNIDLLIRQGNFIAEQLKGKGIGAIVLVNDLDELIKGLADGKYKNSMIYGYEYYFKGSKLFTTVYVSKHGAIYEHINESVSSQLSL